MISPPTLKELLEIVGAVIVLSQVWHFINFIWFYFLAPSYTHKYLHGSSPYALVTGGSDGIGKEVARELYSKGFNIILHGRNEEKVKRVVEEIRSGGARDVQYFIASADSADVDFEKIAERFKDLNITLVINNVGGGRTRHNRIDAYTEEDLMGDIRVNALFSFNLTRVLLPRLRLSLGPALVVFVGSLSADIHIPRLFSYAPCKSFLFQLTRCLNTDERYWTKTNVSFMYLGVGEVNSNGLRTPPNLFRPTSKRFSRSVVRVLGCGKESVIPYWIHAFQQWFTALLGEKYIEGFAAEVMKRVLAEKLEEEKTR